MTSQATRIGSHYASMGNTRSYLAERVTIASVTTIWYTALSCATVKLLALCNGACRYGIGMAWIALSAELYEPITKKEDIEDDSLSWTT